MIWVFKLDGYLRKFNKEDQVVSRHKALVDKYILECKPFVSICCDFTEVTVYFKLQVENPRPRFLCSSEMSLLVLTAFRVQTSALSTKACSHSCDEGRMRENFWVQLLKVIVFSELVVGLEGFGGGRRGRACSRSVPSRLSIHAVQIIVVHARARRRCGGVAS